MKKSKCGKLMFINYDKKELYCIYCGNKKKTTKRNIDLIWKGIKYPDTCNNTIK